MTKKQWLLGIVLADFLALNAYALYQVGYAGVFREVLSSVGGVAVFVDLTIAISLIAVWMWNDAKRRGISPVPYLVTSVLLGSVGPLAYLLRTSGSEAPEAVTPRLMAERAR